MSKSIKYAPRETFEQILEWSVIPTFDLVVEVKPGHVVIVRRKIEPYADTWALPGLRMFKPEGIEDTLERIARDELGLDINAKERRFLGQFVGRFKTEHQRQDLSTGYLVRAQSGQLQPNAGHFTSHRVISSPGEIPAKTGAMYKFYLAQYFSLPT